MNECCGWIRLNLIEGIGIIKKLELIRRFSGPEELFSQKKDELQFAGLKGDQADSILNPSYQEIAERIIERSHKQGIRIIPLSYPEYPEMLKYIYDPPLVLYTKGHIPSGLGIGIVGSRKASGYGMDAAFKMASDLSSEGCVIVSGMARGIDTAAHSGTLHQGGKTIAVLGCGPDRAYPKENGGLMERIAHTGAVVSEYPPGVEPATYHFPVRNRIISGISLGVLVVEAGAKSGSLITAQTALEQGREVFAIPGQINHYNSLGTNKLIKDGAKIVLSAQDILEEIPWCHTKINQIQQSSNDDKLSHEEMRVMTALQREDLYLEEICSLTQITMQDMYFLMFELELKGQVKKDLTGKYRACC